MDHPTERLALLDVALASEPPPAEEKYVYRFTMQISPALARALRQHPHPCPEDHL